MNGPGYPAGAVAGTRIETAIERLFVAQVRSSPNAVAVVFRDEQLSYVELDARANQLANYLVILGVGPEVPVGICADRGIETLIAILAVMKAGGAYLPLDPEYPRQRLSFMLADAEVSVLLTQDRLLDLVSGLDLKVKPPTILCLDSDWPSISAESTVAPECSASLENLAYVIYTSGSTGEPKGVQVELGGLCNMAEAQLQAFCMQPGDRVLQFSSLSFDASIFEIVMALRAGATLVIVPPESRVPGPDLSQFLREQKVSLVTLPPSVLAAIPCEDLPDLKVITVAGEACSAELVERWARSRKFFNLYGPTEATVWASIAECVDGSRKPPIGRPILNAELYLLDEELNPVAAGEPGEIFIAGAGLARGYLKRPQLNSEKFVEHESGSRLYRSGDMGRMLPDGNIEFIGRRDDQVKLRGFRIELGEVEATLRSHPGVRDAVVNLMQGASGEQELVAHVVPQDREAFERKPVLRDYMQQKLPQFMVPAAFVMLDALPLTIQGKVDRRALPSADVGRARSIEDYQAPSDELEQTLVAIWGDVLGLQQVGVKDRFLELGGHSLLATRVVTRIREVLEIELSLAEFYSQQDIAGLAAYIRQANPVTRDRNLPLISRSARPDLLPLSFPQEQVMFLSELAPESIAYNAQFAIRFSGRLDVPALERSLNEILRRHEIFRTCVKMVDDRPCQEIWPELMISLPVTDLRKLKPAQLGPRVDEIIDGFMQQQFDLAKAPLVRWKLLQLRADEHLLIHVEHHLVHDGWSFGVFIHELQAIYGAFSRAEESPLPDLPLQFADYALWQRQWLQGERLQGLLDYWVQKLSGRLQVLQLPTDYPRPPVQSHRGAEEVVDLSPELSDQLRALSQRENSTLYVVTLTVFFVLLHKYSAQRDIVIGTGVANRNRREFEGLIGMIINTIALRGDLSGDPTFRELLARIHEMAFEAYAHQELPFEKLVQELQLERDTAYSPVFQVLFGFHDARVPALEFSESEGKVEYLHNGSSKFDLNLVFVPWAEQQAGLDGVAQDRRITMKWEYATDLFTPATIRGMTSHYQNLVRELISHPDKRLSELQMLDTAESRQLLELWNQTASDFPAESTVHELFARQAALTPDAIAVEYADATLSYAQLNTRSNQLAHYLQARGVGPEVMVGLYLERGLEMIVALLGILKAGGAYVPLDLDYPPARIAFMLEDAQVPVLLSSSGFSDELPEFGGERVWLDRDWAVISQEPESEPDCTATAANLAYVIYTSGSTGTPKGVEIPHRAINRLVCNTDFYQVDASDRIAQASNVSFDAATFEIWGALLNGARLVGIDKEVLLNAKALAAFIEAREISAMFLTTALFNQIALSTPAAFEGLRGLMFGGEAVDSGAVRAVLADHPPQRLLHVYGPTESTTFATWYEVTEVADDAGTVPIGRPLRNTTAYVLDAQMHPVPAGVHGELYIGGDGLARGYLNRPELTAERFVTNPFDDDPQSRLYRTGDRVRCRRDGAIEFLGRYDHQVKIRGFRIELGEIESLLSQHPAIKDVLTVVHEDEAGDRRLLAYLVPVPARLEARPEADTNADQTWRQELIGEIKQYLRGQLPTYMMPSAYVALNEFPLNPNGKVDRAALPLPDDLRVGLESEYTAPRTALEEQLMQIWAEVLKLEQVGIGDSFFDLGGHSLMATQAVSRIRRQMNIDLPLADFFANPSVVELAPVVESLRKAGDDEDADVIRAIDRGSDNPPLSFAQERLWFLDQLDPGNTAYNMALSIRLQGDLSVTALRDSLQEIVHRHEVLRTHFTLEQGRPVQVTAELQVELPQDDCTTLTPEALESELKVRIDEIAFLPFDMAAGPLIRCRLLRLADDEHVLLLAMHHIVSDGWSLGVFFRELGALYSAFCRGRANPLPALPVQYADFALWQRQWLSGEVLQAQLDFWKQQLSGVEHLQMPTDRPRPTVQTYAGARAEMTLDKVLSDHLEEISRQQGATLFMTLLAAFAILLKRYCGQDDIVVGSPIANRNHREIEDLVGFFINNLVLRTDLSGDPSFAELLRRVRKVAVDAYQHQDLPFETLVDELQPERDRSRNPLFQVTFSVQNAFTQSLVLEGLSLERMPLELKTAHFDLEMNIWQDAAGLQLKIAYNTDLFDADTIERLQQHYRTLLTAIAADPGCRISSLPMLSQAEQLQLQDWNRTQTDFPAESTVHELFARQAALTPDAIAVEYADATLSYAQLNTRSNQLAHYLQARGVGPEVMVGLYLERGLEMIVALLGILKAGGAYVPLDLDYPPARIAFMLEDAQVPVLLSSSGFSDELPEFGGERVWLDRDWAVISQEPESEPDCTATAANLAYVIYTSGSTGTPKGVEIPHRAINRLVCNTDFYQVDASDRIAQASNVSFDAATFEIWGALLNGARLVGIDKEVLLNAKALAAFIEAREISAMFLTTALFNQIALSTPAAFEGLRGLMFGGEAVDSGAVRAVLADHPPQRLLHVYGPTESTTFATWYEVTEVADDAGTVPIGRPLRNTTAYVLDAQMHPVPAGVHGELYIGGDGLARGYLNRPELTAERFVTNPFDDDPQSRLYRTGDRVRCRRDGAIEFLGRYDHQVKIRGFRIEPGETESVLAQHPAVRNALVTVFDAGAGELRLVAYAVVDGKLSETDLREYVADSLPSYMLPSAFVLLDEFPLNANGKVDRKALPDPGDLRADAEYTPPRTELETQLTQIWAEVMQLERIGIEDNFFDLGGHSLLATQVVSRIRDRFNIELKVADLFDCPTIIELTPNVEAQCAERDDTATGTITPARRDRELPLSFAQERLWFLDRLQPGNPAYIMGLALRLHGELRIDALTASLNWILQRHEALRTCFVNSPSGPLQIIDHAARLDLRQTDLSALSAEDQERELQSCLEIERTLPFDLSRDLLIRGILVRMGAAEHVLIVSMHHIISDGWSMRVLFTELGDCYAAFSQGEQPAIAELPIQYADFALWQRQWLSGSELDKQLGFWRRRLKDLSILELPTDRPRPPMQTHAGAREVLSLDKPLSRRLEQLSKDTGVSLFMTLLAAYVVLLQRYSGQDDIVIGSPIANRNRSELEGLIAFFVNMLVMRVDCSGDPDFSSLIKRVGDLALEAYAHQDIPFEKLVDALQVERDPSRNPLFQVHFALQDAPLEALDLEGLILEPVKTDIRLARFDLECYVWKLSEDELRISFVYNTNLFDAATIQQMQRHYANLLSAVAADPELPISQLTLLGDSERQLLLQDWTHTRTDYPREQTVHDLFVQQAQATPDAIALEYEGETLSYAQLNARANQLAHYLQARGVGPEVLVGIGVERSLEMVIGLLGILKSGGAYLPLDADYPASRLAYMLSDAAVPVLLTQSSQRGQFADFAGETICLDTDWPAIARERESEPASGAKADSLMYAIYTSGSTGVPKGTLIEHRSAVRLVRETNYIELGPEEVFLQFAPISFDASTLELWGSLLNGSRLVIFPAGRSGLEELGEVIATRGVTTLWLTSALFSQMVDNHCDKLSGVKQLLAGGEALSLPHVQKMLDRLGEGSRLINGYGPTENTTFTCCHVMTADSELGQSVPIGRPISNTWVYVLDAAMQPVPVGVAGELYIGGDGLARGYLNQAELTAEKFVSDPFSAEPGARLYATGDLVRYRRDGSIEFIGRIDQQVKLRGYRIELGEVETALAGQEPVSEAVAVVREYETGDKRLVAYVVPTQAWLEQHPVEAESGEADHQELIPQLREQLRALLPSYMLPSLFVVLEALPLNANGKVDREALPDIGDVRDGLEEEYTAPRNELEQALAEIWAEVLKLERVGVHDNFFNLGGHSLLATQVVSRLRAQLDVDLPLSELFGYPTVAELAPVVAKIDQSEAGDEVIPVVSRAARLPLSFAQERLWFLCQLDPGNATYNMPVALRLSGALDVAALRAAFDEMVVRHESFRTAIRSQDGRPYMVIEEKSDFTLAVEDLSELNDAERDQVMHQRRQREWREAIDLERAPMLRARLLCFKNQQYALFITLHHIIFDGWSYNVFLRELSTLYEQYRSGGNASLPDLKFQFADYASWLRQWLQGDNLSRQLEFWKQSLDGYETLNLPTDHIRPPFPSYRGQAEGVSIDASLADKLRTFTRKHDATLYMTMLSAFNVLLHRYSNQNDIIVGTPVAGRNRQDIEDIIGFFANTLAIRTKVSPELSFIDILNRARQASLDAHTHQDIPFEKLVEELHPDRDASRNPLFQVLFNFVDSSNYRLSLPEVEVTTLDNPLESTKFDLILCVFDVKDGLQLRLDYSLDLFTAASISEMLAHFLNLLQAIVDNPHSKISALPLLSQNQLEEMGQHANSVQPSVLYEPVAADCLEKTIPEVFAEVSRKYADKPAIVTQSYGWTYAELSRIASAVATMLRKSSDSSGGQVALLFPQDAPMLAAILGVLKAGKAYVPLDPNNPAARLSVILEDSQAGVLLVDDSYLELASQLVEQCRAKNAALDIEILSFDSHQQHLKSTVDVAADATRTPESMTYLLYTSGTTGEPKGVIQNDRNVLHHARAYANSLHLRAQDRMTLLSSYSFDAAVMDIFAALLTGASLYPVDLRNIGARTLCSWLGEQAITVYHSTPTVFRHVVSQLAPEECLSDVRVVVLGGEPVVRDDISLYQAHFSSDCLFVNGLGPTESTTALQYWIDRETLLQRNAVPVGYPVDGTQLLLLNQSGDATDILGEIAICSPYLALGYWRQPELTQAKFRTCRDAPDVRMYCTGDLGRRRADGSIEFVGRKDQQLKLRGYRIEAGEVEAALCRFDAVERAAVLLYQDPNEEEWLVAYVVAFGGLSIDLETLRNNLKTIIPSYMIPAAIVELDDLPMTVGGKLDRRQLPAPELGFQSSREYAPPTTPTESKLTEIWEDVLPVDRVGIHDQFFDLGGHSLMATQVISRVQDAIQVKMPLAAMFAHPSIAALAALVDARSGEWGATETGGPIERADIEVDPAYLEELSDQQVSKLLSELAGSAETEL